MGTDEGKLLRPRIGSGCGSAIHLRCGFVSVTPIELPMLDDLLLCASYRESREQREDDNGYSHEVQFHVISPFCAPPTQRAPYDAVPGTRRIVGLLVIVPLWNCKSCGGATGHEKAAATPRLSCSRFRRSSLAGELQSVGLRLEA
jgi:hypothetical protein